MRPATIKNDLKVWKLWKYGIIPKLIRESLNMTSVYAVYQSLYRERRRRGIPVFSGRGRPVKNKKIP
jgi:hypothetical protein